MVLTLLMRGNPLTVVQQSRSMDKHNLFTSQSKGVACLSPVGLYALLYPLCVSAALYVCAKVFLRQACGKLQSGFSQPRRSLFTGETPESLAAEQFQSTSTGAAEMAGYRIRM